MLAAAVTQFALEIVTSLWVGWNMIFNFVTLYDYMIFIIYKARKNYLIRPPNLPSLVREFRPCTVGLRTG